jgi:thioredoxin 1
MKKEIIKFQSDGCMNCRALSPILAGVAGEFPDIKFSEINAKTDTASAEKYEISTLPTLVFLKDGAEVGRMIGLKPRSLIIRKIEEVF